MSADQLAIRARNWPERARFHDAGDSTAPNGAMGIAWAPDLGPANGGGRFVLVAPSNTAGMQLWSSEDGTEFNYEGLLSAAHSCAAYGKIGGVSGFLITREAPTGLYTSTTGTSFGAVLATVPAHGVAAYSASLGLWVIAGDSGAIATSPTASTWTARSAPANWIANSGGCKRIIWTGTHFVILPVAGYNKCLESPDGVTWTERTLPAVALWTGLAYSDTDSIVMACASNFSAVATSVDGGVTWTTAASVNIFVGNDLAVLGSLWVMPTVIANGGGIVWSIDKVASWNRGPAVGDHRTATAGWNRILAADGRFVVAHATGAVCELALSVRSP